MSSILTSSTSAEGKAWMPTIRQDESDPARPPSSTRDDRRRREADRLRDNLHRRKQQSRQRDRSADPPAEDAGPD